MVSLNQRDTVWAPPNKAVDDNGGVHGTIQAAVDSSSTQVLVGPGTFEENVTIATADFNLIGSGPGTTIDGDDGHAITVSAEEVVVRSLSVKTTGDGGNTAHGVFIDNDGDKARVADLIVDDADSDGVRCHGINSVIENILIRNADGDGVHCLNNGTSVSVINAFAGVDGWAVNFDVVEGGVSMVIGRAPNGTVRMAGNDSALVGVVSDNTTGDAVEISGDDVQFVGGLLKASGGDGVLITGTDVCLTGVTTKTTTGTALNDAGATNPRYTGVNADGTQADNVDGNFESVASGDATLSGGSVSVDTGQAIDDTAEYTVLINPDEGADIAASLEEGGTNYTLHLEENTTSIDNPTCRWRLMRYS